MKRLLLINAETNQALKEIERDEIINLADLPTRLLNIEAVTTESVSKVLFRFNQQKRYRSESSKPFALAGNDGGDFAAWTPPVGPCELVVTPFVDDAAQQEFKLKFTVVDEPQTASQEASPAPPDARAMLADPALPANAEQHLADHLTLLKADESQANKCVGFIGQETSQLTIVCAHQLPESTTAQVIMTDNPQPEQKICEFLNTSSPMITSCASSVKIIDALHQGKLIVALLQTSGAYLGLIVESE